MASAAPPRPREPEPAAGGERERPEALEERDAAAAGDAEPTEVSGGAGAAALLGETGLAVGCCIAAALSWERPLHSLGGFVGANLLFWFVALTPWRVYHLTSLIILGVLILQIIKDLVFSRLKGAQLWRTTVGKSSTHLSLWRVHGRDVEKMLELSSLFTTTKQILRTSFCKPYLPSVPIS